MSDILIAQEVGTVVVIETAPAEVIEVVAAGPRGPVGDVTPQTVVILAATEAARDAALVSELSAAASQSAAATSAANAATSESNAATSAATATAQATASADSATASAGSAAAAQASATNAANSATDAANSATASANSATNSANSATAAQAAQTATESARDTTLATIGTAALKANNLSDLDSIPTALANLHLNNVSNTSDADKPISTATQNALDGKVDTSSLSARSGSSLVGFIQSGTDAVSRNAQNKLREFVSVMDFIPAGTDTATVNCTTYIQNAISAAYTTGVLVSPPGTYKVTASLIVDQPLSIISNGGKIAATGAFDVLKITSSNVSVDGLDIESVWTGTFDSPYAGRLIYAYGVAAASTPPVYLENLTIKNCNLGKTNRSGIALSHVSKCLIQNNNIDSVGYAGIEVQSGLYGLIEKNTVTNVANNYVNQYGIYLSQKNTTDVVGYPTTKFFTVRGNIIKGVAWEGLDCHGGEDLVFDGNYLENCGSVNAALVIAHSDGAESVPISGAKRVRITNNTIRATAIGNYSHGIATSSAITAYDLIISGNIIENHGKGTTTYGGIYVSDVDGCVVSDNQLKSIYGAGVRLATKATNVSITNNIFIDSHGSSAANAAAIAIIRTQAGSKAYLAGNSLLRGSLAATYVNTYGLLAGSDSGDISLGDNNFGVASSVQYSITDAQFNDDAAPITNFGITTLTTTTSVSFIESTVTLQKPHSGTTLYRPFVCLQNATATIYNFRLEVLRVSPSQIKVTARTNDGSNFSAAGTITAIWSTAGC